MESPESFYEGLTAISYMIPAYAKIIFSRTMVTAKKLRVKTHWHVVAELTIVLGI